MGDVRTLFTFTQFEQLPDRPGKAELLRGELIELPPAKIRHDRVSHRLYRRLDTILEDLHDLGAAQNLGSVCHEVGYRLEPLSWLKPEVSITYRGQPEGDYLEGAPALAVEVLSESNTARKIARKIEAFLEHGAKEIWVIDTNRRQVRICKAAGPETIHTGRFSTELLPGVEIDLDAILGA